jgi:hypothetical protein
MMDRRLFLTTVAGLLAAPLAAEAQQAGSHSGSAYWQFRKLLRRAV